MTEKKKMSKFAVAALAGAAFFLPAAANAEGFDGPYAGVQGGLGILNAEGSTLAGPVDTSDSEAFVGGLLGYRAPLGDSGVILGAEGDAGIYTDSGDGRYGLSGIAGVQLGDSSLLYGRVGYGWRDGLPADTGEGLVLGGGFETRLSRSVSFRLDYKHIDLGGTSIPDNTIDYSGHEITGGVVFGF